MAELGPKPPITHQELVDASEGYLLNRYPGLKTIGEVVLARRNEVILDPEVEQAISDSLESDPAVVLRRQQALERGSA